MRYTVAWEGPADFQAWSRARPPVMVGLMESSTYLTGQFLLAMPGIGDPRFERAVIAVCAHDSEGAIGIGLGARIEGLGFHDLLGQLDIAPGEAPDVPVHFGGDRKSVATGTRGYGSTDLGGRR